MDELFNLLSELINKGNLRITKSSSELFETLKIVENCDSCKGDLEKKFFYGFCKSINEIRYQLVKLEREEQGKEEIIKGLDWKLTRIDYKLNKKILCEKGCKEKKIEKLTDRCENKEIARLIYESRLNTEKNPKCIEWISFNEFGDIEYLAGGGFGKVYRAVWIKYGYDDEKTDVVLKRIFNSNNKIIDVLREVKV